MYGNNVFNPYMFTPRFSNIMGSSIGRNMVSNGISKGFLSNLFSKFSLNKFLTGTSKTLNVINQAIPIYYQVKPMISNAKTMFKVMNAVKEPTSNNNQSNKSNVINNTPKQQSNYSNSNGNPTFFI